MVQQTRKSNRSRTLTTKAKQLEQIVKKPILRSISTIDDDESTYNNVNFKKRRTSPSPVSKETSQFNVSEYNNGIDDDDNNDDENDDHYGDHNDDIKSDLFHHSDDENIFNSEEEDDYYSAISDYETEPRPNFAFKNKSSTNNKIINKKAPSNDRDDLHMMAHMKLSQSNLDFEDALFDSDSSDSSESSVITPTSSHFNFIHNVGELKSLEENFQKIINENNKLEESKPTMKTPIKIIQEDATQDVKSAVKLDEFVNYTEDLSSEEEDSDLDSTRTHKKPSILHYRHDEKHNLAFPDVSTFPIRYDPIVKKRNQNKNGMLRALNRRAILSGKASEMVGTGVAIGDFNLL